MRHITSASGLASEVGGKISRRTLLSLPLLAGAAACSREVAPFGGYAFVANQNGNAVAAVDLGAFALARHIALDAAPSQVLASSISPHVYALTPETGMVHRIDIETLSLTHSLRIGAQAISMAVSPPSSPSEPLSSSLSASDDEQTLYVLTSSPRRLVAVSLGVDQFKVIWSLRIPDSSASGPVSLDIAQYGERAAISTHRSVRFVDLATQELSPPMVAVELSDELGSVRFLNSGGALVIPDLARRRLSLVDTATARLITHLPLAVRPDNLCFSKDGGQLFVTGEGMDAVIIVYPYNTPEVASTVLAGPAPGAMAASATMLFVASPTGGDVSVMDIATGKVIAVAPVGSDPGAILITPNDEYALVLNRQSGDIAVLRVNAIAPNRFRSAGVLTMIPVGSRPVSIALGRV